MSTTLYRFFDARDRLLYVGITGDPGRRLHQHSKDKAWWRDVVRSTMEHHPSRIAARAAETAAIQAENPLHNIVRPAPPTPVKLPDDIQESDLLTTGEVASLTGWSVATISRMADKGKLPTARKLAGVRGARLFLASDVLAFTNPEMSEGATA